MVRRYLFLKTKRDRKTPAFHRNWTYREIVVDVHRKELDKMAAELLGSKLGSPAYIACYGKAFKTIEEGLDEETWVKYRSEAKQWSEHKPPPRQQQRCVTPIILSGLKLTRAIKDVREAWDEHTLRVYRDDVLPIWCAGRCFTRLL